jgi:acetylornithine/N-succinyldiaminopimelate aminotransferase
MTAEAWIERARAVFTPNYKPAPVVVDRGEGAYVFDVEGRRYLDLVSGIAVSALGHAHPVLVEVIREQAVKVLHTSNLYWNQPSIRLAERLVERSFGDKVFFCSSGAEANEACIKLARRYHFHRGDEARTEVVSFRNSFHGRTLGALAATAQPKYHEGFAPLPGGFRYLDVGDPLDGVVHAGTAAVLIEPVQGEGGVRPVPDGYLREIRAACDRAGALMIVDEVQCGVGRTGDLFAYERSGVKPDLMALAKGLGAGLPLGAMIATEPVAEALQPGTHGTTYGGNPLACAVGLAAFDIIDRPEFLAHVSEVGQRLRAGLEDLRERRGVFREVRGRGLMIGGGIDPGAPWSAADLVGGLRSQGVLAHVAGPETLRFVPPLILTAEEADHALAALDGVLASDPPGGPRSTS